MLLKKVQIDFSDMNNVVDSLVGIVRGHIAIDEEKEYRIRLVSKELLTNVLTYSDANAISLCAVLENEALTITIEDDGRGFAYKDVLGRDVKSKDYLLKENGRGVFLVQKMSDDLRFNDKGNAVMVKLMLK